MIDIRRSRPGQTYSFKWVNVPYLRCCVVVHPSNICRISSLRYRLYRWPVTLFQLLFEFQLASVDCSIQNLLAAHRPSCLPLNLCIITNLLIRCSSSFYKQELISSIFIPASEFGYTWTSFLWFSSTTHRQNLTSWIVAPIHSPSFWHGMGFTWIHPYEHVGTWYLFSRVSRSSRVLISCLSGNFTRIYWIGMLLNPHVRYRIFFLLRRRVLISCRPEAFRRFFQNWDKSILVKVAFRCF